MDTKTASQKKRVTNGYSLRFPEAYRKKLELIALEKSRVSGKNVPLSDVLKEAVEYGLPIVQRDILHQKTLPFNVLSRTEKMISLARSIANAADESGIELPGEAA